ncbi:hypothetical protein Airi02_010640 [Actinoallomurus iriomotensis]|uniref:Uncharacterized protein n=2 Tax=Actinoallomurus iriomotensis TaxID=478107 RepID=A0A9W6RWK5_9ACTN|nr:hypothetical protein Airi02_010640 [Actinoallomurus iriomotensis]
MLQESHGNLTHAEIGEPVGNALNHNLLLSTTLVPPDLAVLDEPPVRAGERP